MNVHQIVATLAMLVMAIPVSARTIRVHAALVRVLYSDSVDIDASSPVAAFPVVTVNGDLEPAKFANLVKAVNRKIVEDNAAPRQAIQCSLVQLIDQTCAAKRSVLYDMVLGGKRARLGSLEQLGPPASWNITKTYVVAPLLAGYDCTAGDLRFKDGAWKLTPDPLPCAPQRLDAWVVSVAVGDIAKEAAGRPEERNSLRGRLKTALYDALEAAKDPKLTTFRAESKAVDDWRRSTPPMMQIGRAKRMHYLIRVSVD